MPNWKNILFSATIGANCLLCFLLVFYDRLTVPSLLQVVGRAHPLFLHFPIVLFALFIAWIWIVPKKQFHSAELFHDIGKWLLLGTAFTAAITALMGVFLSKEPAYNPESLQWHKWSGSFIAVLSFLMYAFYDSLIRSKVSLAAASLLSTMVLIVTGHQGASITHGDNFLLAPVYTGQVKKKVSFDDAVVFTDMVKPILDAKCISCHNSKKAKGELVMETPATLIRGGKTGPLWDTTDVNMSLILQRLHLPEGAEKHMPPIDRPQLSEQDLTILYNWIRRGANFKIKASELEPTDTLRSIAQNIFSASDEQETYDFSSANENTIRKLNTNYRAVYLLAKESPAIVVDFFGAAFFKPDQLKDLLEIKTQLVSLNLDKMPVTDKDLQTIGQFTNLRNLNLSFSKISGNNLSALDKLSHLKSLSITNTPVKKGDIEKLTALKALHHLYIWNSGISIQDAEALRKKYPLLDVETGMRTDTMFLKINPPILLNDQSVVIDTPIRLKLKHFVPGTVIRYTLDGTEPDSIHSLVYNDKTFIDKQELMKARAFKKGWHGSDSVEYRFYKATYKADTMIMLKPPDSNYKAKGGRTLNDFVKGNQDFRDGKWLGFRDNNMECLMVFAKPVKPRVITISSLVNVGALVFPPKTISIFGGMDSKNLKLLYHLAPPGDTLPSSNYLVPYECRIAPASLKYIKVVIEPIGKMPKQFLPEKKKDEVAEKKDKVAGAKKDKPPKPFDPHGWFFIDEIFLD